MKKRVVTMPDRATSVLNNIWPLVTMLRCTKVRYEGSYGIGMK